MSRGRKRGGPPREMTDVDGILGDYDLKRKIANGELVWDEWHQRYTTPEERRRRAAYGTFYDRPGDGPERTEQSHAPIRDKSGSELTNPHTSARQRKAAKAAAAKKQKAN